MLYAIIVCNKWHIVLWSSVMFSYIKYLKLKTSSLFILYHVYLYIIYIFYHNLNYQECWHVDFPVILISYMSINNVSTIYCSQTFFLWFIHLKRLYICDIQMYGSNLFSSAFNIRLKYSTIIWMSVSKWIITSK